MFQTALLYLIDNSLGEDETREFFKLDHFHELGGNISERDQVVGCIRGQYSQLFAFLGGAKSVFRDSKPVKFHPVHLGLVGASFKAQLTPTGNVCPDEIITLPGSKG